MTKHCKCIKKYIKLTAPHHRKKKEKKIPIVNSQKFKRWKIKSEKKSMNKKSKNKY
jgi:hypothetical protein